MRHPDWCRGPARICFAASCHSSRVAHHYPSQTINLETDQPWAQIIDGKKIAAEIRAEAKVNAEKLTAGGVTPCLAAVWSETIISLRRHEAQGVRRSGLRP